MPDDSAHTMELAMRNDMEKLIHALHILYNPLRMDVSGLKNKVYVDRLVYSQLIYDLIRRKVVYTESEVHRVVEDGATILNDLLRYVGYNFRRTMELPIMVDPTVSVMFLVPNWEELSDRRITANDEKLGGRTYPAGKRDWEWYNGVAERLAEGFGEHQ